MRTQSSGKPLQSQDTDHNIVELSARRATKAQALAAYARARTTAERFDALMQLADARLNEQGDTL